MAESDIAVIGMACRFPGAPSVDAYWRVLRDGVEAVRRLDPEELRAAGVDPERILDPNFVPVTARPDGVDQCDAEFFGWSPKEAAMMDPQHRVFLEVAWDCMEQAGHRPGGVDGTIGVFAGSGVNTYMLNNLLADPDLLREVGWFLLRHTGNDKDFLSTRASYEFDLRGPSVNVQTACSTSLVAIHMACQSLLSAECDLALAGGSTIEVPTDQGYVFRENEILAPDGHCRAFDADAAGTVFGNGAGAVILRRLDDALADGDTIWAVIKGSAVNNDGARKVGYLAPSVDGHAEVVAEALAVADVDPSSVGYVEAHGTGTPVGDPIEVKALTTAFRDGTEDTGFCLLGSVKPNIGHLDTAAGIASFIKAVLAVHHGQVPPTLHFREPNPLLELDRTPFVVSARAEPWRVAGPRRAGVSSLGVGGTNCHVVLEQAPDRADEPLASAAGLQVLPVSARSEAACRATAAGVGRWLAARADDRAAFVDGGHTLAAGRQEFRHRAVVVAGASDDAVAGLTDADLAVAKAVESVAGVVFLFPGGGAQHVGMARALHAHEPLFRQAFDRCMGALEPGLCRQVIEAMGLEGDGDADALQRPTVGLPALFAVEFALAETLIALGVEPAGMVGHSLGEYACAAVAGVLSPEDAMRVVHLRGVLFEDLGSGAMVSVPMAEADVRPLLDDELAIAAINAPELCVVSGTAESVARFEGQLAERDVEFRRLHISAAAHSHLLDPLLDRFREGLAAIPFREPTRPFISNLTGTWITAQEASDREYWVRHLRQSVRFSDGVGAALEKDGRMLLEVGPGQVLTSLSRLHPRARRAAAILPSQPHAKEADACSHRALLGAVGGLWAHGLEVDWVKVNGRTWGSRRRRVPMAGYAFQRKRHWIDARVAKGKLAAAEAAERPERRAFDDWFERVEWVPTPLGSAAGGEGEAGVWLVLCDEGGVGDGLVQSLRFDGIAVAAVRPGDRLQKLEDGVYRVPPLEPAAWTGLLEMVRQDLGEPARIAHLWLLDSVDDRDRAVARGPASVLHLMQAMGQLGAIEGIHFGVATHGAVHVGEGDRPVHQPLKALVHGVMRVIPHEYPGVRAAAIDLDPIDSTVSATALRNEVQDMVAVEANRDPSLVALRPAGRFVAQTAPMPLADGESPFRDGGVYVITGGLGGVGMVMARHLATRHRARLVLLGRRGLPAREAWPAWSAARRDDPLTETLRAIQELESAGAEVAIERADVAVEADWVRVLRATTARFGALDGVLLGAGLIDDGLIHDKTLAAFERVLEPKVDGCLAFERALEACADGDPSVPRPEIVVAFASTSASLGLPGQVDYAAANAFLDAWAQARTARGDRTVAVDWGIWKQLGLVADDRLTLAPPRESEDALLGTWGRRKEGGVEFVRTWTATDWMLAEHRVPGVGPVMPGTGILDLMTAALRRGTGRGSICLDDVRLVQPLMVADGERRDVIVALVPAGAALRVEVRSASGAEALLHAWGTATAAAGGDPQAAASMPDGPIAEGPAVPLSQQGAVEFGAHWQCLRAVREIADDDGPPRAVVDVALDPAFAAEAGRHPVHPALLDAVLGAAMPLLDGFGAKDTLYVPAGFRRCTVWGAMPAKARARITVREDDGASGAFRIEVFDAANVPVLEIQRVTVLQVPRSGDWQGRSVTATIPEPMPPSPTEARVRALAAQGIRPDEGGRALEWAIRAERAQVIVAPVDRGETLRWLGVVADPQAVVGGDRPESSGGAPRDDLELALCGFWRELLGLQDAGLDDDFFQCGGHSLIAVRLFAKINKAYSIDVELAALFSAPTPRALAAMLRRELGLPEPSEGASAAAAQGANGTGGEAPRFQHLVPIQQKGDKPTLYLVHGAGGNVLGFRDLAQRLGSDQPVWGLQARGVDGRTEPHGTVPEMAADYAAELRRLQPEGPYYLGGYSGGGAVAYEMAQQLTAAGHAVALVAMLDTFSPKIQRRSKAGRIVAHVRQLLRHGPGRHVRVIRQKLEGRKVRRRFAEHQAAGEGAVPHDLRGHALTDAFVRAFVQYQPVPYHGPVVLFRALQQEIVRYEEDRTLGWRGLATELTVLDIPGNHDNLLLEPQVPVLCRLMRQELRAARERATADAEDALR